MGLYRATVNCAEAKCGKTAELDDNSLEIRRRVAYGHLVPVDDVAKAAVAAPPPEDLKPQNKVDAIRAALAKAKEEAPVEEEPSTLVSATSPEFTSAAPRKEEPKDDPF